MEGNAKMGGKLIYNEAGKIDWDAIFDNNAGHLQWISTREIYLEALKEFDVAAHIGPHKRGLKHADWKFYRVRDEKAREIADWHEHGIPGAFGPCIWMQTWVRRADMIRDQA